MYQYILFDLDGTVTDPGVGITNSVCYALRKCGIEVEDRTCLYRFIGPPLQDSFAEYYHFNPKECERAVALYREYFREKGIYENELYKGMDTLLKKLQASGRQVILATSKPESFAVQILQYFHIDAYFDYIAGATMDGRRSKKTDIIAYALEQCNIRDLSSAVMIGDREYDILGAKEMGLDSIGVLYGYGTEEELQNAGATYMVHSLDDILSVVM